jgi:hypothetical protein
MSRFATQRVVRKVLIALVLVTALSWSFRIALHLRAI